LDENIVISKSKLYLLIKLLKERSKASTKVNEKKNFKIRSSCYSGLLNHGIDDLIEKHKKVLGGKENEN
jgi:hypothetical protein